MTSCDLFPFQRTGATWLASRDRAFLADEMGLGKTCQAVTACSIADARRVAVVCPAMLAVNWRREFGMWWNESNPFSDPIPSSHIRLVRKPSEIVQAFSGDAFVAVFSYDFAALHAGEISQALAALGGTPLDALILDEAHYLKNRKAKRTLACYSLGGAQSRRLRALDAYSKRVWCMSGTPMLNYPDELWTHLKAAGLYSAGYHNFVDTYCETYDDGFSTRVCGINKRNVAGLKAMLDGFVLRRKMADVLPELPPLTYNNVSIARASLAVVEDTLVEELTGISPREFFSQMDAASQMLGAKLDAAQRDGLDLVSVLESMAGESASLRKYIGAAKAAPAADLIADMLDSDPTLKVVVFAQHRCVVDTLCGRLARFGAVRVYGGVSDKSKQAAVESFQTDPETRVFVGNIKAAGVGITLTASHHVIFVEQSWTPGDNDQAARRCLRIGQESDRVECTVLALADSVDERVQRALVDKQRAIAAVFG